MAEVKKVVKSNKIEFLGTGRRKTSVARVRLSAGNGKIVVNGEEVEKYLKSDILLLVAKQPLAKTGVDKRYDVAVNVTGGGLAGQAGAISHGISRALIKAEEALKPELKKGGFLTRDSRMKERKKYGLKKARKASQFSKR